MGEESSVQSEPGEGTTFVIELERGLDGVQSTT